MYGPQNFSQFLFALAFLAAANVAHAEFLVKSPAGSALALIDDSGNCVLNGTVLENQLALTRNTTTPEFVVKNSTGDIVARIDGCTGDLFLAGEVSAEDGNALDSLTGQNFIVKSVAGDKVAAITEAGDLILSGTITTDGELCEPEGECECN